MTHQVASVRAVQQNIPTAWSKQKAHASELATDGNAHWWFEAGDQYLNNLVQQALEQNITLAVAGQRLYQAQYRFAQTRNQQWPQAQGQVNLKASQPLQHNASTNQQASASLGVSWEIDIWQRLAAQTGAAEAFTLASKQDQEAIRQSVVASVVREYWQLTFSKQRVVLAEKNLNAAQRIADILQKKYRLGAVSGLAQAQSLQLLADQESNLAQARLSFEQARQALALLIGQGSQGSPWLQLPDTSVLPSHFPPDVVPGLPSTVLGCRPDVAAAQSRAEQAFLLEQAAARQWYPAITLTGSISGSSVGLVDVLKDPLGVLGAAITMPFLQWRERQLQVDVARSEADVAVLNFQSVMYQALTEVDKALGVIVQSKKQLVSQQRHYQQAKIIEQMTKIRYQNGSDDLQVWLDAQQNLWRSELDLAQAFLNAWTHWANSMLALGMGGC